MEDFFTTVREACSTAIWSRAVHLARGRNVTGVREGEGEIVVRVVVAGQRVSPTVTLWPEEEDWSCDCRGTDDPCAHVAAGLIAVRRGWVVEGKAETSRSEAPRPPQHSPQARPFPARPTAPPAPRVSPARSAPAGAPRVGYRFLRRGNNLAFQRVLLGSSGETKLSGSLINSFKTVASSEQDLAVDITLGTRREGGLLPTTTVQRVLATLLGCTDVALDGVAVEVGPPLGVLAATVEDAAPAQNKAPATSSHEPACFVLRVGPDTSVGEVFDNGAVLQGQRLHPQRELALSQTQLLALQRGQPVPADAVGKLVGETLPWLRTIMPVHIRTERLPGTTSQAPHVSIDVWQQGAALSARAQIVYGDPPVARVAGSRLQLLRQDGVVPLRDTMAEQTCARRLRSLLGMQPGVETQARNEQALSLAKRLRNNLPADFVVCGDAHERCQLHGTLDAQLTVTAERVTVAFASGGQTDDAGTRDTLPADAVFAAWNDGQSLLALPDGGFARLPSDWLERHGHRVAQFLAASAENRDESAGALGAAAGPALLKLCEDLDHPVPAELAPLRALVHDFVSVPAAPLPADLQAELRDYQRDGVNWLCFLRRAGIGALLADDMGLGKTLQALCAVAGRTLIVAPTSVLYNWANEAARFRPSLRVQTYHGPRRELDPRADFVLTSYALLRLDQQQLSRQRWDTVVLDESQTIRNPQSQVFQAAAALPADWRLALTGTPVENRLTDLWSQFHFLNPGLLGGLADFEQRYGTPITDGVQGAAEALRSLTRPLILRRLKGQVAKELPPRTDVVLRCQLSEEERRVYDTVHAATQREVVQQLDQGGSVLGALAALLRLRQAACHSGLLPGQQAEGSAKVNLLVDTLAEVIAEEHKALVFSQWTGLLDRIEPQLQAAGIDFVRLDGSTRDRQAVVQRFQQTDGPPVMLISLKAGGVGLTLTQADHVFLTDPWWNPAVEDQAADRAHRIGQQRPVLVHRLIAEDTLEERILELQQHKRSLASAALDDAQTAAGLTRQDLLALLR